MGFGDSLYKRVSWAVERSERGVPASLCYMRMRVSD